VAPSASPHYLTKLDTWFTPAEVLKMATHDNAQMLAPSGPRNPYPGKLGVIEEGALADMLLVDGDPVADIKLLEDAKEPARDHEGRLDLQEPTNALSTQRRPHQSLKSVASCRTERLQYSLIAMSKCQVRRISITSNSRARPGGNT